MHILNVPKQPDLKGGVFSLVLLGVARRRGGLLEVVGN